MNISPNTIVFPVDSKPYGKSYAEWSAIWWQWILSIPNDTSPAGDSTGKSCATNQQGPIWFLAGTFGGAATVIQIDITNTIKLLPIGDVFKYVKDISSNEEQLSVSPGPFQVICKYPSDENIDNEDFDSIEAEIKNKHFGDQVTFHTVHPGHDNMEDKNLVIGEFSAPKGMDRSHITKLVKETVSKYVTVLGVISNSRFND